MENNEDMRELEAELTPKEELRHQHELEKIHVKGAEDRITETLKAENAKALELTRDELVKKQIYEEAMQKLALEQAKIREKAEEDCNLENLKYEHSLALENQKCKNQIKVEWHKVGALTLKMLIGAAAFFGIKSYCDTHDLSVKNIPNDLMK